MLMDKKLYIDAYKIARKYNTDLTYYVYIT